MLRAIREIKPTWVVGENVRGIVSWSGGLVFEEVCAELEALSYQVQPFILPAAGINAPHRRDRVWFVAYSDDIRKRKQEKSKEQQERAETRTASEEFACNSKCEGLEGGGREWIRPKPGCKTNDAFNTDKLNGYRTGFCSGEISQQQETGIQRRITSNPKETERELTGTTRTRGDGFTNIRECDASNTDICIGRKGRMYEAGSKTTERYAEQCDSWDNRTDTWNNFPTQPPVCRRDDGFSFGLDGITFSKWRRESIKAYGNAVVPQIPYKIFRAIEDYMSV